MNSMKYTAMQLTVIAERVFERDILATLAEEGAKGHTISECGGNSAFHMHPLDQSSLTDAFHLMKIEVIVHELDKAERMATRLMNDYFQDQPGIVSLHEVQIFRPQKF